MTRRSTLCNLSCSFGKSVRTRKSAASRTRKRRRQQRVGLANLLGQNSSRPFSCASCQSLMRFIQTSPDIFFIVSSIGYSKISMVSAYSHIVYWRREILSGFSACRFPMWRQDRFSCICVVVSVVVLGGTWVNAIKNQSCETIRIHKCIAKTIRIQSVLLKYPSFRVCFAGPVFYGVVGFP